MNKRRLLIALFLLVFICVNVFTSTPAFCDENGYPEEPDLFTEYCILMDADSGIVLYESNADEKCYPASVTKLMTALLVVENCNLTDTVTISSSAVASVKYGDATAALKKGEEFTVEQALNVMLIKSANDMAYALGEHVGGTMANFATMMNKKAAALGCTNTHFANASGLTDVNHYTTPRDMAIICQAVLENPVIMKAISYTKNYSVPPTNKTDETRYYKLSHSMITGRFKYEYAIGGKTGYTDAAGHTLATFAEKDGLRLICIMFRSADVERYEDTIALFEYGFNNFYRANITENETSFDFENGVGLSRFGISGDALKLNAGLRLTIPVADYILIPNGVTFDEMERTIAINDSDKITPDNLATINYYYDGHLLGSTRLMVDGLDDTMTSSNGLPVLRTYESFINPSDLLVGGRHVAVNIWLVLGIVCILVLLIILLIHNKKKPVSYSFRGRRGIVRTRSRRR